MTRLGSKYYNRLGAAAVCLAGLLAASGTLAHNSHKPDKLESNKPTFEDKGDVLQATAKIRRLDKKRDVKVEIRATAEVRVSCTNKGGNKPPGAQPDPSYVYVSGSKDYKAKAINKHGRLRVRVKTDRVDSKDLPDCPNKNWTRKVESVEFLHARLEVKQKGKKSLTLLCTFHPPTKDGDVPRNRVKCAKI